MNKKYLYIAVIIIIVLAIGFGMGVFSNNSKGGSKTGGGDVIPKDPEGGSGGSELTNDPLWNPEWGVQKISFFEDFESGTPEGVSKNWHSGEAESADRFQIVTSPVREGKYALRVEVRPGDQAGGNKFPRTELKQYNYAPEGSERWYAWSFLVPEDYAEAATDKFQIMAQWHEEPDFTIGQTWETLGPSTPVLSVNYGQKDGKSGFSVGYGIGKGDSDIAETEIKKGEWIDIMFNVKWSQKKDGFVEVWVNGKSLTKGKFFGANMKNKLVHSFKIGLYRDPAITSTNFVYFDDVRISDNRKDVEF